MLFKKPVGNNLSDQINVLYCMPQIFFDEDNAEVGRSVTLPEIEQILNETYGQRQEY